MGMDVMVFTKDGCSSSIRTGILLENGSTCLPSRLWFQICFIFTPRIREMIQFDEHIVQVGWFNHQVVYHRFHLLDSDSNWLKEFTTTCWFYGACAPFLRNIHLHFA